MTTTANPGMPDPSCGARLAEAREAAGLTVHDVAKKLRVPPPIIESLEAGDWDRLGAPVFVRGHLRSYARLLGVRQDEISWLKDSAPIAPSELVARSYTSVWQRLAEQTARRLVYVVITAAIVVPVWMVTRSPDSGDAPPSLASLDVADIAAEAGTQREPVPATQRPYVASIAAIQSRTSPLPEPAPIPAVSMLSLQFTDASWVDIRDREGNTLEQGVLEAGEERAFDLATVGSVVLGNAQAVEVRRNGQLEDLASFQRASVARFAVSSDGSLGTMAE